LSVPIRRRASGAALFLFRAPGKISDQTGILANELADAFSLFFVAVSAGKPVELRGEFGGGSLRFTTFDFSTASLEERVEALKWCFHK